MPEHRSAQPPGPGPVPPADHATANFLRHHGIALLGLDGSDREPVWITRLPFLVGRGRNATMPIHDDTVSRRHAEIRYRDGALHLEDLGSSNGSWVNGERIEHSRLRDGDRVHFGSAEFQLLIEDRQPNPRPADEL